MADLDSEQKRGDISFGSQSSVGEMTNSLSQSVNSHQLHGGHVVSRRRGARKAPKPIRSESRCQDPVLRGFISSVAIGHVDRRQVALRLRARLVAVEFALSGEQRATLPAIAERVGVSTRTLNMQFGVRDALFAFPPPELVPVLVECWLSAGDAPSMTESFKQAFRELDENPLARSLLMGLAQLHTELPNLVLCDGYFNAALRSEIIQQESVSNSCLRWTGYITDALRDTFREWVSDQPDSVAPLESVVSNLMEKLRPIAFR
jgi:AcrR family transcriptional regulator